MERGKVEGVRPNHDLRSGWDKMGRESCRVRRHDISRYVAAESSQGGSKCRSGTEIAHYVWTNGATVTMLHSFIDDRRGTVPLLMTAGSEQFTPWSESREGWYFLPPRMVARK